MNDLTQQLLLTGIGGFLIGTGFTWLLTRGKKQDKTELDAARQELQTYRQEVERHFIDTADAVDELTRSYQKVFTHLSRGAETLMSQESYRSQLEKRSGQAVTLTYLSQQTADTAAEQARSDIPPPDRPAARRRARTATKPSGRHQCRQQRRSGIRHPSDRSARYAAQQLGRHQRRQQRGTRFRRPARSCRNSRQQKLGAPLFRNPFRK